jgi:hypothetical protein
VTYAINWGDDVGRIMEALPGEAQTALAIRFEILESRPYGNGDPAQRGERFATFGEGGEGLLSYWVDDDEYEIWITRVAWYP